MFMFNPKQAEAIKPDSTPSSMVAADFWTPLCSSERCLNPGMRFILLALFTAIFSAQCLAQESVKADETATQFVSLLQDEGEKLKASFTYIDRHWQHGFAPMAVEILSLARRNLVIRKLVGLLQTKTGQNFGSDINEWFFWIWNRADIQI